MLRMLIRFPTIIPFLSFQKDVFLSSMEILSLLEKEWKGLGTLEAHSEAMHALLPAPTVYEYLYLTPTPARRDACLEGGNTIKWAIIPVRVEFHPRSATMHERMFPPDRAMFPKSPWMTRPNKLALFRTTHWTILLNNMIAKLTGILLFPVLFSLIPLWDNLMIGYNLPNELESPSELATPNRNEIEKFMCLPLLLMVLMPLRV